MPVSEVKKSSVLKIRFENGLTEDGRVRYKTKSISGIVSTASNEDIMQVVEGMGSLVDDVMDEVNRVDSTELQSI